MAARRLFALVLVGTSIAGCSAGSGPKELGGTAAGAVAGGLIGNAIGGSTGNRLAGTLVGAALDDEDRRRAYAAQMQALETGPSGAPVAWRNPDSGRYGDVVPGPAYQATNGASCRQYTHTIYVDGTPQTVRGAACRNPDGTWTTVE